METLTIKTPADVLSFIGHTLGFWPHESLVCITLADNHVGATLRVDLPKPGTEISYAHLVAGYLAHDAGAASVLFAVYTSEAQADNRRPQAATIAAHTGALAEFPAAQQRSHAVCNAEGIGFGCSCLQPESKSGGRHVRA